MTVLTQNPQSTFRAAKEAVLIATSITERTPRLNCVSAICHSTHSLTQGLTMETATAVSRRYHPTSNQYELVCRATADLGDRLMEIFPGEALGNGLGEITSSVSGLLPTKLRGQLYFLTGVRNAVVHRNRCLDCRERQRFADKATAAYAALDRLEA